MRHLAKYMHDVVNEITEIWCDASGWSRNATEFISEATCIECLQAAETYGEECHARRVELQADRISPSRTLERRKPYGEE